jgi:hypothetical protein
MNPGGGLDPFHSEQGVTIHGQLAAIGESFRGPIGAFVEEGCVVEEDPAADSSGRRLLTNAEHAFAGVIRGHNRHLELHLVGLETSC